MGAFTSRQNAGVEELDIAANSAYRYPPKSGCYFGSHFIMGGERFDTTQPEAYLFGENSDLNFLGNRPLPFPYPAPQPNEPTKTLKSLVNIRKDSLRLVRVEPDPEPEEGEDEEKEHSPKYNVEFTFDTDVKVGITIHYFATEEIVNGLAVYTSNDPTLTSETVHYKRGASQMFSLPSHVLEPSMWNIDDFSYDADKQVIPMVIQCCVEEEEEHAENLGHAHMLFATFEKNSEECFTVKPLKQKQMVDGLCYLLQEIYGIENKNSQETKHQEDDIDDSGSECVICMSDIRDTLILPCRHLCLCNGCADSLRYQASNCPICRQPFRALLQMRAMRKKTSLTPAVTPQSEADEVVIQENIPPGYEVIPLIEALNGPSSSCTTPPPPVSGTHEGETLIAEPLVVTMPPSPQGSKPQDSVTCRPKSKSKRKRSGGSSLRGTAALEGMSRQQQAPEAKLVAPPCDKSDRSDASSVGTGPYVTTPDDSESAMSPSIVSSVPPSEVDISERSSLGGEVTTPETPAACSAQVSSIGTPGITPSCTVDGDLSQQDPEGSSYNTAPDASSPLSLPTTPLSPADPSIQLLPKMHQLQLSTHDALLEASQSTKQDLDISPYSDASENPCHDFDHFSPKNHPNSLAIISNQVATLASEEDPLSSSSSKDAGPVGIFLDNIPYADCSSAGSGTPQGAPDDNKDTQPPKFGPHVFAKLGPPLVARLAFENEKPASDRCTLPEGDCPANNGSLKESHSSPSSPSPVYSEALSQVPFAEGHGQKDTPEEQVSAGATSQENRPGPSGANLKSFVVPRGDDPRKGATAAPRDYDYVVIHEESHGDDEASENDDDEENENDDFEGPALRVPPIGVMRDAEAMDIPASDKTSMDNGCVELSLPGTPLSSDSSRSGNSVSSTRQLLSTPSNVQLEEEEESHISPLLA
ncbi:PREDICTED: E3 ubiquitin-protein ligase MGRN1-like isoform X4 [Branchiostoma belcheri]|uniref:RING-type E3 ubiquitin transferase n=1 Tax=Branchiostoma belcheri TaxID=7741 RepID=A0A6P4ZVN5_BRABE|nr:PREDICTED: E3 ubiquitin-protein ligase MGRN1-like isoform X4 [Branchiostoma belcheri]